MEINRILFRPPPCSYKTEEIQNLIWVPKSDPGSIPCILLRAVSGSSKILIFFHGNAEDLKQSYSLIDMFKSVLNVNVIAVEYPGYGLYKGKTNESVILSDARTVYKFVKEELKFNDSDILVFGRSIGSGPACYLARHNPVGCLLLMSAFTSVKGAVKSVAGRLAKMIVKERFKNIALMPFINCPTFLVHGIKDKLIPSTHSQKLHEDCAGPCALFLPPRMEHNKFEYCDDLILPISMFLAQSQIDVRLRPGQRDLVIDKKYCLPPEDRVDKVKRTVATLISLV